MYLKLIANSLNQFLVDSYFGPGDLEMGTVVREDYDLVTPREFVWTYHSLLIKEITHMYILIQGLILFNPYIMYAPNDRLNKKYLYNNWSKFCCQV